MKENQISLPKIKSVGMEIVLEYTYTGSVKEESLTKDNILEALYAADYFQLSNLQDFITKIFNNTLKKNSTENYLPELLSKAMKIMPLTEDNSLLNSLVEAVATIPLNTIEFGRLSIAGLQFLLSCTYDKEITFVTPEYEVFRYSAILAAKQVSNDAYSTLMKQLPTLEQMKMDNSVQIKNIDHQRIAKELEPLVEFIDFKRINGQILADVIDPLEIIPSKVILNVYRDIARSNNSNLNDTRGIMPKSMYVWDESACGSNLIIEDNGKVIEALSNCDLHQNARTKIALEDKGIFEWDVIIGIYCLNSWVGVCASENFNYEKFAGIQPTGWVLSSGGMLYNNNNCVENYCPSFNEDGARITVHLDMNKKTCAFTVNGKKYREVSEWNNLPSKLYPVVSLIYPGRFRIQPHQKNV
ncbi:hypothetical protein C1646_703243 [Rhizophagus diaphanus]|nr:hypothetical protein C1646_703243 [Rhizophagus diaphanus] [Rhizophagus sp. MUCL 43196]